MVISRLCLRCQEQERVDFVKFRKLTMEIKRDYWGLLCYVVSENTWFDLGELSGAIVEIETFYGN